MPTISGYPAAVGCALVPGGAVGEVAVPGSLKPSDTLLSVEHIVAGTPPTRTDITAECSNSATKGGVIETSSTDTTGDFLHVLWSKTET